MFEIAEELKNSRISREFILCMTAGMRLFILERLSALENGCTSIFRQAMMRGSKSADGKTDCAF